jgi:hypothetical protein
MYIYLYVYVYIFISLFLEKEVAEDYAKKLVEKGLVAEAKSSKEPEAAGQES